MKDIKTTCNLLEFSSWVREPDELILNHATGYFLIGCIAAIKLKEKLSQINFPTKQPELLLNEAVREVELEAVLQELKYQKETNNGVDEINQLLWADKLINEFLSFNEIRKVPEI